MKRIFNKIVSMVANLSLVASTLVPLATPVPAYATTAWSVGDVFVGVAGGSYKVYDNAGVFKETISDGLGGFTTGCAFNGALDKLYTTNFSNTKVVVYNDASPHTIAQTVDTNTINAGGHSESIVFAANGDFYVGHPDGNDLIHKYDAAGNLLATYSVAVDARGTDWIDLSSDQSTLYYTSEGRAVQVYNTATNTQLPNFAALPGSGNAFALRLLPPGDGTGGLLVADGSNVKRLDGAGAVVATYDVAGEDTWFALNLDPNGTSFWSGNFGTANFYRFNIATGVVEVGSINTGTGSLTLFGICLKGELTAAGEDTRRMTGGGTIPAGAANSGLLEGKHGFELHCDSTDLPNRLEVNWGKGNRFHLETLDSAVCSNDPLLDEEQPAAGFDTYKGTGTGRLNGVSGATAEWTFTDNGEPGVGDYATIKITQGLNTYEFSGNLKNGNHQAHAQ